MNIVWFKRDLRISDNESFTNACKSRKIMPLYIIEPELWQQDDLSYRQYIFLKESLEDLDTQLRKIGQKLIIRKGDALEIFKNIHSEFKIKEVWSHQETWNKWTFDRDLKLKKWFKLNQITWNEAIQNGVIRGLKSRDGWSKEWHKRMYSEIFLPPKEINNQNFTTIEIPSPEEMRLKNVGIP